MSSDLTTIELGWLTVELAGPRAKLRWAFQHLQFLDVECQRGLQRKPFLIAPEFDSDTGCHDLCLRIREDAFPSFLGLRAGDAIHNARSALDQAVWLIACRSNPIETLWEPHNAKRIAFPVLTEEKEFPRHRTMPFIADDAKAVLDGLQPYKGGGMAEAMSDLDTLWNIDKHRVIHKTAFQLDLSEVGFVPASVFIENMTDPFPKFTWHRLPNPLEDGAKVASVRFRNGAGPPEAHVQVNGEPSAIIGFGSGEFSLAVDVIGDLFMHVNEALSRIEALPEQP